MALRLIHSNRVEILTDRLAADMRAGQSPEQLLAGEYILCDNPSLGPWINLQLALRHSVAANIHYLRLEEFFWKLARLLLDEDIPRDTPLNKQEMKWRLLTLLFDHSLLEEQALAPVRHYLADSTDQNSTSDLKRYQLAAMLADLYDQYQVFRPDWFTERWEQDLSPEGIDSQHWRETEQWQRQLWQNLLTNSGRSDHLRHRAAIQQSLCKQLATQTTENLSSLPFRRLFVFGVTAMPPVQLELLLNLAKHRDIFLYLHNPCAFEWFDIRSAKEIVRLRKRAEQRQQARLSGVEQMPDENALGLSSSQLPDGGIEIEIGNPLLAAQGGQVRDFLNLIFNQLDAYWESARVEDELLFFDPDTHYQDSLLGCVQQEILDLQYRGEVARLDTLAGEPRPWPAGESKQPYPSVHIHQCNSPLREVEVLHDQLLDMFHNDPDLYPRDVVVMMPRVGPYRPFIQAVFEGSDRDHRIPFHITDLSLEDQSPILKSFASLLQTSSSRFALSEVLGLLEVPAIQRRFGLDNDDFEQIKAWLIEAGVRWGLDEAHRKQEIGTGYREFSWDFGLNRLWAGYAINSETPDQTSDFPLGVEPLDQIEGSNTSIFNGFLEFWESLGRLRERLGKEYELTHWHSLLLQLLDDFYAPEEEEWRALNELREGLDELHRAAQQQWFGRALGVEVIAGMINPTLTKSSTPRHPWSEGVKFCSLLPMRGIPFKVVYLLGMNLEDYPRRLERPSFDLMQQQYRPGDRSARTDDRWLFLEALLSARKAFHVSYIGQDMHRNEPREPSILVSELEDYISGGYQPTPDNEANTGNQLTTRHPLQPFSARYFRDGDKPDRLRSFKQIAFQTAQARQADRVPKESLRWIDESGTDTQPLDIDLDQFILFFTDPPRWFFKQLGVSMNRYDQSITDEEMWALEPGLGQWQLVQDLLVHAREQRLQRDDDEPLMEFHQRALKPLLAQRRAQGAWPVGKGAGTIADKVCKELKEGYLTLLVNREIRHHELELKLGGLRLLGKLALLDDTGPELVVQSASKASEKYLLEFYLKLAIWLQNEQPAPGQWKAKVVFRDKSKPEAPGVFLKLPLSFGYGANQAPGDPAAFLEILAELYLKYRQTGLPFDPGISRQLFLNEDEDPAQITHRGWFGADGSYGRSLHNTAAARAYFGGVRALNSEQFLSVSRTVWTGLQDWLDQGEDA